MPTWLHTDDVYASLAEGEPGRARDWGTTHLALSAPDRFSAFPDDERCHDVVLAAGPPGLVASLIDALKRRRPCPSGLGNACAALGTYGDIPEDPSALVAAIRDAMRKDGDEADLWLAYALSTLGAADVDALRAAATLTDSPHSAWILPIVILRVAESMGALDDAAAEVARDLASAGDDPHRLIALLMAMGAPLPLLAAPQDELDAAVAFGSACADEDPRPLKLPPGSKKRRQQHAVRVLLDGIPGPMAALLRAVGAGEQRHEWGLWPVAIAAWLEASARTPGVDPVTRVLVHGASGDGRVLSEAQIGRAHV